MTKTKTKTIPESDKLRYSNHDDKGLVTDSQRVTWCGQHSQFLRCFSYHLYFGGSSGNLGLRGPVCSDLFFFDPDILKVGTVVNFRFFFAKNPGIMTVGNGWAVNGQILVNLLDTRFEITESGFANCHLKSLNPSRSSFDCYFSIWE